MLVILYQATLCRIPEYSSLQVYRCENLIYNTKECLERLRAWEEIGENMQKYIKREKNETGKKIRTGHQETFSYS
jgi:hypothetical protein